MRVNFELLNLQKLVDKFSEKQNRIKDTLPLMKKISIVMFQSVMRNFQEEGTDKEKWKPLSAMTIAMRRKGKGKGSAKILQDTGYLRRSIFPVSKNDIAEVYTNVPYAPLHQFGGNIRIPARTIRPKKKDGVLHFLVNGKDVFAKYVNQPERTVKIPKRPFMVLREEAKERIKQLFKKYLI